MSHAQTPRAVADAYVDALVAADPVTAVSLGVATDDAGLPDWSPDGFAHRAGLARAAVADLEALEAPDGGWDAPDRRCATLLAERLGAALAQHDAGEDLRRVSNLFSPVQSARQVLLMMPTATDDDWVAVARRMADVPSGYRSYRRSLEAGVDAGQVSGPRQVETVVEQIDTWLASSWFAGHADGARLASGARPGEHAVAELAAAAERATSGAADLRDWLAGTYLPACAGQDDTVGRERYGRAARVWNGVDLDLDEAYAWGWEEYHRIAAESATEAERVLPGASAREAMDHLDAHGPAIEGVEKVRAHLQQLMDEAIAALDGVHVDLAEPVRHVEAMIAPPGSAAAPYYTRPSLDFARPGRTWLPTLGKTRFPLWSLVSTWYHEGVPGHHLQLAQWVLVAPQLSRYQVSVGSVSATTEGWALYAERLMDELGFLSDPGSRLGYLEAQMMRAVRVVIDIGMHLGLDIPAGSGFAPGQRWTPALAQTFFGAHSGRGEDFVASEIVRYLGMPGQAVSYKLGERAWLAGRQDARDAAAAAGREFDAKAWHMAALSLGSLGLGDLQRELAVAGQVRA